MKNFLSRIDVIIEPEALLEKMPDDLECIGDIMSNLDHEIEPGAEERLRSGRFYGEYAAWNFFGIVWFDDCFKCQVKQYRVHVATITGDNLSEIMDKASNLYGYD